MILHKGMRGTTKGGFHFIVETVFLDSKPTKYALIAIELQRPGYYNPYTMHACVDTSGRWCHDGINTEYDIATVL